MGKKYCSAKTKVVSTNIWSIPVICVSIDRLPQDTASIIVYLLIPLRLGTPARRTALEPGPLRVPVPAAAIHGIQRCATPQTEGS